MICQNIFIGDNIKCDLFADDAKLSKHARGTADAGMLQLGFNRLFQWTSKCRDTADSQRHFIAETKHHSMLKQTNNESHYSI